MDVETIGALALLLLYLFFQFLGGRQKRPERRPAEGPAPQRRPAPADGRPVPSDLEEALREIRIALGHAEPEEPPVQEEPAPAPPPRPTPAPEPALPPREFRLPPSRPAETSPLKARTPLEKTSLATTPPPPRPVRSEVTMAPLTEDVRRPEVEMHRSARTSAEQRRTELLHRLQNSDAAREAVILSEILGPPRARRRAL